MTKHGVLVALVFIASATHSAAQSPAPAPVVPPVAFANLQLPSWVRLGVEYRGRLEGPMGIGFAEDREDLYWLNRFRVTARFSIQPWLSAVVQGQDARVEGRNGPTAGAPFRDQFDLRLAHADVGAFERSRAAVRVGRQELAFGDQRYNFVSGTAPAKAHGLKTTYCYQQQNNFHHAVHSLLSSSCPSIAARNQA